MGHIKTLHVQHVRNHTDTTVSLSSQTTIITGRNGAGKTSLIEALYISLRGTSFKGSDSDIVQHDSDWYRIDLISADTKRIVKFDNTKQSGKKSFDIDGKIFYRLPVNHKYPVVIFEPEDLRLITGSPSRRRQSIDHLISQIDPEYARALKKYERALRQRNSLLKHKFISNDELFAWNVAMSEYGSYIMNERTAFIEKISEQLDTVYHRIAPNEDMVQIHYSHTLIGDSKQKLLAELTKNIEKDKLLGFTSTGPHRDDVLFSYNNSLASAVASRGENKTIVLAMKLIEADIIKRITTKSPVIILDDVFSELDERRQTYLIETTSNYQTVITTATDSSLVETKYTINLPLAT
jgi:DNA replication and repair protein RecF